MVQLHIVVQLVVFPNKEKKNREDFICVYYFMEREISQTQKLNHRLSEVKMM
jgi:hypothetical protein